MKAIITSFKKSTDNKPAMADTELPSTFRMPISLVRRVAQKLLCQSDTHECSTGFA